MSTFQSTSNMALPLFLLIHLFGVVMSISIDTPSWPHPYWDIPGDYCRSQYPALQCCPGRQDRCSMAILGTLCYCDTFCNRTTNADCCPDYFTHCEGLSKNQYLALEPPKPSSITRPRDCKHGVLNIAAPVCLYKGVTFSDRDTIKENCNTCSCQVSKTKPGCMEVLCTTDQCMVEEGVIEELREGEARSLYSWRPSNYSEFWGRSLEDGIRGKLGSLRPQAMLRHMSAIQFSYDASNLPSHFDAREEWPGLLDTIKQQGWCSSSWAISTAAVAGDRVSINNGNRMDLSEQTLLSCDVAPQAGCDGGHVDRAWGFMRHNGVWTEKCFPYTGNKGTVEECPNSISCHQEQVQMQPAYKVGRKATGVNPKRTEEDIMHEIQKQGPVQAVMEIFTDFFMYGSGVYQKTNLARSTVAGYHAVRILGWGEEGNLRYWIVANSWGSQWGEGGLFRIKRGDNSCQIEEFVLGAWPREKRSGAGRRRRRRRRRRRQHRDRTSRTRHQRRPVMMNNRDSFLANKHYFQVG